MTVKELIEILQTKDQNAIVYTMNDRNDKAYIVTDVKENILEGKEKTIVIE